jgi:RNA polymerase sigma factor (sigma-70 family)
MGKLANELFERHQEWALWICRNSQVPAHVMSYREIEQAALIGLFDAARRWERRPRDRGFKYYAHNRVRGQVVDTIRKEASLTRGQYSEIKEDGRYLFDVFLDVDAGDFDIEDTKAVRADLRYERAQEVFHMRRVVMGRLHRLDRRELTVFRLVRTGVTQLKIGEFLGVSEARVCQLLKRVRTKLARRGNQ